MGFSEEAAEIVKNAGGSCSTTNTDLTLCEGSFVLGKTIMT